MSGGPRTGEWFHIKPSAENHYIGGWFRITPKEQNATKEPKNMGKTKEEPRKPVETLEKNVNHPARYTKGKVECIDAIDSAVIGKLPDEAVCVGNVIKYLWRYEEKEPLRSAMSVAWYLDRLINKLKAKEAK